MEFDEQPYENYSFKVESCGSRGGVHRFRVNGRKSSTKSIEE